MIYENDVVTFIEQANIQGLKMLLVGGGVVNFHGYQRHSADVVFWIETSPENTAILLSILKEMDYEIDRLPPKVTNGEQNISIKISPYQTLELITQFNPNKSFSAAWDDSIETEINGHSIARYRVLSYEDLVTSKVKSDRPNDLLDIQELKRLRS